jgi:hypothetical protein
VGLLVGNMEVQTVAVLRFGVQGLGRYVPNRGGDHVAAVDEHVPVLVEPQGPGLDAQRRRHRRFHLMHTLRHSAADRGHAGCRKMDHTQVVVFVDQSAVRVN